MATHEPLIPATTRLPEITLKAIVIGVILTIILTAANCYLGMKAGMTISASIPAAVIALGILQFFRHNVLEINIIQTAASAGEAIAAGALFTMPAFLISHFWTEFNYFTMLAISIIGGVMGVLFSVLLRRVLLADKTLRFPEGVAIGNVLKASFSKNVGIKYLVQGGLFGAFISVCQNGFQVISEGFMAWTAKANMLMGFGSGLSPALLAAGYILGANVGLAIFVGIIIGWVIGIPLASLHFGFDANHVTDSVMLLWSHHLRYIGVGTMIIAGVWTILCLFKPIIRGVGVSLQAMHARRLDKHSIIRTELDLPIHYAGGLLLLLLIPTFMLLLKLTGADLLGISHWSYVMVLAVSLLLIVVLGFVITAVCGYFAGLVGSTNSPISSMVIASSLLTAICLFALLGPSVHFSQDAAKASQAVGLTILLVAIMGSAGAISSDTIQDLKAGQMVGATPWKQQFMLIIGVVVAALVMPLIFKLLFDAYGIGGVFPRAGMDPTQMLGAPQATLLTAIAQGMFGGASIQWDMLEIGAGIGIVGILVDEFCKTKNTRFPVLSLGFGIYLPQDVTVPLVLGAFLSYLINRKLNQYKQARAAANIPFAESHAIERVTLLACGLVAGSSLSGVVLAIPFAIYKSSDVLAFMPDSLGWLATILGIASAAFILVWMYRTACHKKYLQA